MYNLAIIDNDEAFCAAVEEYIKRYGAEAGVSLACTVFSNVLDLLMDYCFQYDIVFIGLSCGIPDGLDTARRLRRIDSAVQIILLDTSHRHAAEGYACDVQGFLVKPVDYASLEETLKRVLKKLAAANPSDYLILEARRSAARINVYDLLYVEAEGHSLIYRTSEREIRIHGRMAEAEQALAPHGFCRAKAGCLVNLSRADEIDGLDIHIGGDIIRMSAKRRHYVMEQFRVIKAQRIVPPGPAAAAARTLPT